MNSIKKLEKKLNRKRKLVQELEMEIMLLKAGYSSPTVKVVMCP